LKNNPPPQPSPARGEGVFVQPLSRFQILTEAFGGIKEVKIAGLEDAFIDRFDGPSRRFARTQVFASVVGQRPRYALEILAFGGMLLVVLYLMRTGNGLQGALPIIALYAFAAYRLMPALQQFYAHLTLLRFASPALDSLHRDLVGLAPQPVPAPAAAPLPLARAITLERITYAYPRTPRQAIQALDLEIPAFSTVGLVGATGSGKTTTVDIILGLLPPIASPPCATATTSICWKRAS
jgi:ABC-type multidrug transport system fused ATPase/permease subunit